MTNAFEAATYGALPVGFGERTAVLVHADCGDEFEQGFWCRTCSTTFGPSEIRSRA